MIDRETALMLLLSAVPLAAAPAESEVPPPKVVCSMPGLTRTKSVSPLYPAAAVKARKSGRVVIETVITDTGKTADVRVKQGVTPDLDQAAVDAVKQWEYEPLLVNGTAQPVVMTVTVEFKLPRKRSPGTDTGGRQPPK